MDGLQFQDAFLKLWYSDMKQVRQLIETIEARNLNQLPDLVYSSKAGVFSDVISSLFFTVEDIQSLDESTIRSFIEESYFPNFRNHFDDSFFPPRKIDLDRLDRLIAKSYKIFFSVALLAIGSFLANLL